MNKDEIQKLTIRKDTTLQHSLKKLDEGGEKILYVLDENEKFYGTLTDGDIRRWILNTGGLSGTAGEICNENPISVETGYNIESIKSILLEKKIESVPIVENGKIIDILVWEKVFEGDYTEEQNTQGMLTKLDIPVVIMAGGKGTRLDPFTRILPKPLIPIGEKPIIEIIIDRFRKWDINKFYLSVNHKSRVIKAFFEELNPSYSIEYLEEEEPLGTAGSLKFLEGRIQGPFIVSNCDIIIDEDYAEVLQYHQEEDNDITLVASVKNYNIPYGVCDIENGGILKQIREKPEYNFLVNTGLYIINSEALKYIPKDTFFHTTDLIAELQKQGKSIGVYPVSEKSWIDVGEWEEYQSTIAQFKNL
ncbi:MAG: nucleotidyltransferase family protein [Candidatus Marinimicrobia bacterium]|nr:nucleotidyltransferase family protein [Candidatus Neomarinimicrobiota bacterium]MCF7828754.1 nucleotidyltransferase family protein [Candidatus Neomarinimicrobiota bacterium]MCF7880671.1 nucleotidyltransferase family protein [Candidatus Neomarinimicrobiota bacterium]